MGDSAGAAGASALLSAILVNAWQFGPAIEILEAALVNLPDVGADEVKAELLAMLSRALMRTDADERAVEVADLALAIAERLNLDRVMAEALINKASSLSDIGRPREGIALMEAALQIAQAGGFVDTELRARNNLASVLEFKDPSRSLAEVRASLRLAERAGNLEAAAWAVLSEAESNYRNGDEWDGALAQLDDLGARMADTEKSGLFVGFATLFRVARGLPIDAALVELDEGASRVSDPRNVAFPPFARADIALLEGDYRAAHEGFLAAADAFLPTVSEFCLAAAVRAALWLGDPERARAAADRLDADPSPGRATTANGVAARAGIAALEGHQADAIQGFLDGLRQLGALGYEFDVARVALDFVLLVGPDIPEARAAGEQARVIFERVGAKPYLERLDAAMARATPSQSESTAASVDSTTAVRP